MGWGRARGVEDRGNVGRGTRWGLAVAVIAAGTLSACLELPTMKKPGVERCLEGEDEYCSEAICASFDAGELPAGCLDGGAGDVLSDGDAPATDTGTDTGASQDAGPDMGQDTGGDEGPAPEITEDTGPDTGEDATPDAIQDVASDGGVDVGQDTGGDVVQDVSPPQCTQDGDCAGVVTPSKACEVPRCVDGACQLGPAEEGTACDDGDPCTGDGACASDGTCQPGAPVPYDDSNDWVVTAEADPPDETSSPDVYAVRGTDGGEAMASFTLPGSGGTIHGPSGDLAVASLPGYDRIAAVTSIDSTGQFLWVAPMYGSTSLIPTSVLHDGAGGTYVGLITSGTTSGYSASIDPAVRNGVVARLTSDGMKSWSVQIVPSVPTGNEWDILVAEVMGASAAGARIGFFMGEDPVDVQRFDLAGGTKTTVVPPADTVGGTYATLEVDWTGVPSSHYMVFPVGTPGAAGDSFVGFPRFQSRPGGGFVAAFLGTSAIRFGDEAGTTTEVLPAATAVRMASCAWDETGGLDWVRSWPMDGLLLTSSYELGVKPSTDGGSYVSVSFMGTVHIETEAGPVDAVNQDAKDALLLRVSSDGTTEWGLVIGGLGTQSVSVLDPSTNPIIGGTFDGELQLGGLGATGKGAFVAQLDDSGDVVWAKMPVTGSGLQSPRLALAGTRLLLASAASGTVTLAGVESDLGPGVAAHLWTFDLSQWESCP